MIMFSNYDTSSCITCIDCILIDLAYYYFHSRDILHFIFSSQISLNPELDG